MATNSFRMAKNHDDADLYINAGITLKDLFRIKDAGEPGHGTRRMTRSYCFYRHVSLIAYPETRGRVCYMSQSSLQKEPNCFGGFIMGPVPELINS